MYLRDGMAIVATFLACIAAGRSGRDIGAERRCVDSGHHSRSCPVWWSHGSGRDPVHVRFGLQRPALDGDPSDLLLHLLLLLLLLLLLRNLLLLLLRRVPVDGSHRVAGRRAERL